MPFALAGNIPQGLKPDALCDSFGAAEAAPLQGSVFAVSSMLHGLQGE